MEAGVAAFAGRQSHGDVAADFRQRLRVFRVGRLLQPEQPRRVEVARHRYRGAGAEAAVTVDHDVHVGADRVADRQRDLDALAQILRFRVASGGAERIELQAAVAFGAHGGGGLADLLGRTADAVPGVGVGRQAFVHAAA